MQFRKCSINGVIYGGVYPLPYSQSSPVQLSKSLRNSNTTLTGIALRNGSDNAGRQSIATHHRASKVTAPRSPPQRYRPRLRKKRVAPSSNAGDSKSPVRSSKSEVTRREGDELVPFSDKRLQMELADSSCDQYSAIRDFFTSLAVCHSVLVSGDISKGPKAIKYLSQSPDEAALVQAAKDTGFVFLSRQESSMIVDVLGEQEQCTLLNIIEFNSTRKRMSVIVRRPAGEIVLYCKGADSVIYERLMPGQDAIKDVTASHLEVFATEGLRTLCISYSILPEAMYNEWAKKYHQASVSLTNREEMMDAVAEEIEQNMLLIGATAIEDKLQDGVPECIAGLANAGIKLWVLTGDKMETAINIGLSCNLLTKDMNLILIKGEISSKDDMECGNLIKRQMQDALVRFWGPEKEIASQKDGIAEKFGLVIDGSALLFALDSLNKDVFLDLATRCEAVICCRVSPLQKAQVVDLVKCNKKAMCLAIGDGANDVSMIQAANVGVGIAGEEGLQAVMASDYAIGQFRFVLFWFQIHCGFSAEVDLELTYMLLYNLVLSSLPVATMGILDMDITDSTALKFPQLYRADTTFSPFTIARFFCFVLEAAYQAVVCFYFVYFGFAESPTDSTGRILGKAELSVFLSLVAILNANGLVAVNMNSWNILSVAALLLTQVTLFLYTAIYSYFPDSMTPGVLHPLFGSINFWLGVFLISFVCQCPRVAFLYFRRMVFPTDVHIIQEVVSGNHTLAKVMSKGTMVEDDMDPLLKSGSFRSSKRVSVAQRPFPDDSNAIHEDEVEDFPTIVTLRANAEAEAMAAATAAAAAASTADALPSPTSTDLPHDFGPIPRTTKSEPDIPAIAVEVERQFSSGSMYSMASVNRTPVVISPPPIEDALLKPTENVNMLTVMKTGQMLRNRGYSFSQSPGARDIIMGRHSVCVADLESPPIAENSERENRRTSSTPMLIRTNTQ
ncbi:hypothetical protein HDU97_005165 [Phlyctochytrium planicorne]|nr:hypothetical protein HDU97_005165 [Phlyctochytrium planicorne]